MAEETKKEREIRLENVSLFEAWRKLIPDARTQRPIGQVWSPLGLITRIYCLNCGKNIGGVYGEPSFVHVLCDKCRDSKGGLPGMEEVKFTPDIPPTEE